MQYDNFYHNLIVESNPFEDANVKAFKLKKGNDLRKFIHLCVTDGKHMPIFNYEQNCYDTSFKGWEYIQRGNAIFDAFCRCNLYKVSLIKANYKNLNDWLAQNDHSNQNAGVIILN